MFEKISDIPILKHVLLVLRLVLLKIFLINQIQKLSHQFVKCSSAVWWVSAMCVCATEAVWCLSGQICSCESSSLFGHDC